MKKPKNLLLNNSAMHRDKAKEGEKIMTKVWGLLLLFLSNPSLASIGYTPEELKSLSNLEFNAKEQGIDSASQQAIQTQQAKSIQFQEQIRADAAYWQEKLDPRFLKGAVDIPQPTENPNAAPTGVMVFVSLTMPKPALKALLKQSEAYQVPLVIRGVLPQGFAATAKKIQSLIQEPGKTPIQSGFAISPEWFRTFNVTEVPTFVVVKPGKCLPKQPCTETDYDRVKGNVSLNDALRFLQEGDAKDVVKALLMRGPQ
ncbi:type-F conjugative transfer system pilin assembly protein TrbC [Vibrio sp. 10N.247.311.51]|uniref:type-F conjugative transfer system pilin assembly protein TrbC n=1 Tax=Vibrio sp. 10N.247.311.51 TaxID=3229996 RepID=UPI00354DD170